MDDYVEIEVDGLPVEVSAEDAALEDIEDRVRAGRAALRLMDETEADDYDTLVGDDSGVE